MSESSSSPSSPPSDLLFFDLPPEPSDLAAGSAPLDCWGVFASSSSRGRLTPTASALPGSGLGSTLVPSAPSFTGVLLLLKQHRIRVSSHVRLGQARMSKDHPGLHLSPSAAASCSWLRQPDSNSFFSHNSRSSCSVALLSNSSGVTHQTRVSCICRMFMLKGREEGLFYGGELAGTHSSTPSCTNSGRALLITSSTIHRYTDATSCIAALLEGCDGCGGSFRVERGWSRAADGKPGAARSSDGRTNLYTP